MHKKSQVTKILLFIGGPIALTYLIVALVTLTTVNRSITDLTTNELTAKSQAAAHEINTTLATYLDITEQISCATRPLSTPSGQVWAQRRHRLQR